jgi:acetoacetyl-CoA synthetase
MMSSTHDQAPLWSPSAEEIARARMTSFMRWVETRRKRRFADYAELWEWSSSEIEEFWADIWEFCGVRSSRPYERVLGSHEMPGASWFEGARLNYAENMLLRDRDPDEPAVLHTSELRPLAQLTWGELSEQVAAIAGGLRSLGVCRGDRVVAYMPNIPETLIAFLATASIGAIWSAAAPEFGARSVIDRFAQIEPKVLLAVDGYRHGGRDFDRREALETISAGLPSVEHTVMLPYLFAQLGQEAGGVGADGGVARAGGVGADGGVARTGGMGADDGAPHEAPSGTGDSSTHEGEIPRTRGAVLSWEQLSERGAEAEPRFEQVPFDHPLWVLYSSGTTGLPKAIVHGHGGILLEQLKKSMLHLDLRAGDRMFWFTTTGWMMWNFLVGCLFSEAAIVLYDGSPAYPDLNALWELAQSTRMSCMGISAGLLVSCQKADVEPGRDFDLSALRGIGSTGSPLPPESFHWVYQHVKRDVWLFSTSGGTDVCTAFVGGCPLLPVYEGELQCRVLGCAVESWDERGRPLQDELGELVLTKPLPSMPLFFWGDGDPTHPGERYRESYFDMYPGIWRHGDWLRITPRGGAIIYGRSDSTINRQGVRMGTSEIYRATGAIAEVTDALVVVVPSTAAHSPTRLSKSSAGQVGDGLQSAGEELRMILFVVLSDGVELDEDLEARIKRRLREDCSPRHVPNEILQIAEVPRTLSGKVLEVPVKRILMGLEPDQAASVESLSNPRSLDYFVELAARLRSPGGNHDGDPRGLQPEAGT